MALCSTSEIPQQAFQHWWQQQGDWVEEPNVRRGGESGVQRLLDETGVLYAKKQIGHIYRSLLHPHGRPTVLRERKALQALPSLGVMVPRLIYCGVDYDQQQGWRGLLVTEALEGFENIELWYAQGGREACGEAVHAQLLHLVGAGPAVFTRNISLRPLSPHQEVALSRSFAPSNEQICRQLHLPRPAVTGRRNRHLRLR